MNIPRVGGSSASNTPDEGDMDNLLKLTSLGTQIPKSVKPILNMGDSESCSKIQIFMGYCLLKIKIQMRFLINLVGETNENRKKRYSKTFLWR